MIFVDNENINDPRVNLAIEEHLVRNFRTEDDILLFYINQPSIIIGRNQNTIEEINQKYVDEHGIIVVRRLSGGGAVYHDLQNLNFSFISNSGKENLHNYKKFTGPVVKVLNAMDVPAELGGRNDILVDGRKVSGNAQYSTGQRMVSHGTLLFNSDLSQVAEALNVRLEKIESKGIKSVRSRVANISEFLNQPMNVLEFRERVKDGILTDSHNHEYHLSATDWDAIRKISTERYQLWDWNYGHSPFFNIQKTRRFPIGQIDARIDVEKGLIKNLKIYGDFLGMSDIHDLETRLIGARYEKNALLAALSGFDLQQYFGDLSAVDLVDFLVNPEAE
jgi:lipoate-protein ligase A